MPPGAHHRGDAGSSALDHRNVDRMRPAIVPQMEQQRDLHAMDATRFAVGGSEFRRGGIERLIERDQRLPHRPSQCPVDGMDRH